MIKLPRLTNHRMTKSMQFFIDPRRELYSRLWNGSGCDPRGIPTEDRENGIAIGMIPRWSYLLMARIWVDQETKSPADTQNDKTNPIFSLVKTDPRALLPGAYESHQPEPRRSESKNEAHLRTPCQFRCKSIFRNGLRLVGLASRTFFNTNRRFKKTVQNRRGGGTFLSVRIDDIFNDGRHECPPPDSGG